jgi:hypothetical protein
MPRALALPCVVASSSAEPSTAARIRWHEAQPEQAVATISFTGMSSTPGAPYRHWTSIVAPPSRAHLGCRPPSLFTTKLVATQRCRAMLSSPEVALRRATPREPFPSAEVHRVSAIAGRLSRPPWPIAVVLLRFQPRPRISAVVEHSYKFPSSSSTSSSPHLSPSILSARPIVRPYPCIEQR